MPDHHGIVGKESHQWLGKKEAKETAENHHHQAIFHGGVPSFTNPIELLRSVVLAGKGKNGDIQADGREQNDLLDSRRNSVSGNSRSTELANEEGSIFPNPAKDALNIAFRSSNTQGGTITVLDMTGRLMSTEEFSYTDMKKMDVNGLTSGQYLLTVDYNDGVTEKFKFVKRIPNNINIAFNEIIRKVAIENSVILIDLDKLIPKTKEYMYDSVHLSNKGSTMVAGIIAKELNQK